MDRSKPASLVDLRLSAPVATITLTKPERGNAICLPMVEALIAAFSQALATPEIRLIVLRGAGKHFCTGLDLSAIEAETDSTLLHRFVRIETLRAMIEASSVETLALASGSTFGAGADLMAACDHRLALPGARFAFPGSAFGIVLGTARLATLVGPGTARAILTQNRRLDAEEALRLGLLTRVVETTSEAEIGRLGRAATRLDGATVAELRRITHSDQSDRDLAALTRSASVPGLKARILAYRATLT